MIVEELLIGGDLKNVALEVCAEQLEPDVDEMGWGAGGRCYNPVTPI